MTRLASVRLAVFAALSFCLFAFFGIHAWAQTPTATYDYAALGAPKFVNTVYIDLNKIVSVSKFRSNAGHDYSDSTQFGTQGYKDLAYGNKLESCRSMKHYFMNPDATTNIYAPVSGTVTKLTDEDIGGTQIQIAPDDQPAFAFIMFHVELTPRPAVGDKVVAGQLLGHHTGPQTWSDIAVFVNTPRGLHLISYFETLTDTAFAQFQSRGIATREQMILSRDYRDANLVFSCLGKATAPEPYASVINGPAALNGSQYVVIAPTSNGENGNYSYIRLFNGASANIIFMINVLGSPSGASYGIAQPTVPPRASVQYSLADILSQANAPALFGGDTSYSLYLQNGASASGYQHVIYNAASGFFENLSNCKSPLNTGLTGKYLVNVHTPAISQYPSLIQIHNTRNVALNMKLTFTDAETGNFIRSTPEASQYALTVAANASAVLSVPTVLQDLGFTPQTSQYHVNVQATDAGGGNADMTLAHIVRNQVLSADLNMTAACAVATTAN